MTSKRVLAIGIIIVLIVFVGVGLYLQGQYNYIGLDNTIVTPAPSEMPAVAVVTNPSNSTVKVGRSDTVSVNLPTGSTKIPRSYDLTFTYDKNIVEVVNIVPGRLWTGTNVLKKTIDNTTGTVRLAAGQGFNANITENKELLEIEYRVLKSGSIVFNLAKGSKFAYPGDDTITPVTSNQVVISAVN